jgi:hypothetical protein
MAAPKATRLCRQCGERAVPPCNLRRHDYLCSRCRNARPSQREAAVRYRRRPEVIEQHKWRMLSWRRAWRIRENRI